MDVIPLTAELLSKRTVVLHAYTQAAAGPTEGAVFSRVVCDGCGRVVDLLAEGFPVGWTTTGDFKRGWTDLCRGCSQ